MTQAIVTALKSLDVNNDNHWTADGKPRLETVKMLAADQALTREAVQAAAPEFTRTKAVDFNFPLPTGAAETATGQPTAPPPPPIDDKTNKLTQAEKPGQQADESNAQIHDTGQLNRGLSSKMAESPLAPAPPGQTVHEIGVDADGKPSAIIEQQRRLVPAGTVGIDAEGQPVGRLEHGKDLTKDVEEVSTPRENEAAIKGLERELEGVRAEVAYLRKAVEETTKEFNIARQREDALTDRLEALRPKDDNTSAIMSYLESQKKEGQARAQRQSMFREAGVNLSEIAKNISPAPIDQPRARKTS